MNPLTELDRPPARPPSHIVSNEDCEEKLRKINALINQNNLDAHLVNDALDRLKYECAVHDEQESAAAKRKKDFNSSYLVGRVSTLQNNQCLLLTLLILLITALAVAIIFIGY